MSYQYGRSSDYPPDRIWGTIFIVLYSLMLLVALLVIFAASAILAIIGHQSTVNGNGFPTFIGFAFGAMAGIFVIVSLGAHIFAAVGMHKSRAWGFWATIAISVFSLASSGGATFLTIVPLIYSILRLAGTVGPKPV